MIHQAPIQWLWRLATGRSDGVPPSPTGDVLWNEDGKMPSEQPTARRRSHGEHRRPACPFGHPAQRPTQTVAQRRILKSGLLSLVSALFFLTPLHSQTSTPLGLPTTITDLYIPGSEIEPIPRVDRSSSLVIRILEIKPAQDGHRYDLELYGVDRGTHKLSDYLRHTDTLAPVQNLDHTIEITTQLPLDILPEPQDPANIPPEKLGGYRTTLYVLGILWFLIFLAILFLRKKKPAAEKEAAPPPTLQEKLTPLVTAAAQGELSDTDRARLERLILGHWKKHLPEIQNLPPSQALQKLRQHPDASPLLLKLEHWLHSPNPTTDQSEIAPLLAPFGKKPNHQKLKKPNDLQKPHNN